MNLKLVVASMSILGLVSCPVLAATTTTQTKHKYHHTKKYHHYSQDYKNMGALPVQPAPVEVCTVSQASMIMDQTTQSLGRAMPNPCNPGWFNRIQMSGGINIDMGKWGNRNMGYMGENYQHLSLNDVYLNFAATVNDWTKAFASISYSDPTILTNPNLAFAGEYSAAYSNNVGSIVQNNHIQLEQAYVTIGNFDCSPIYLQLGKQFQEYGKYKIHPITRDLTQVLTETLATSVKLGFIVPMGFHGSIFVFDDPISRYLEFKKHTNYGASIGFDQPCEVFGWSIGASWLYDVFGVNDIAYTAQNYNFGAGYHSRQDGIAAYADVNSGPFNLAARYTTSLGGFNPLDAPRYGVASVVFGTINPETGAPFTIDPTASGAKPWAASLMGGYNFEAFGCRNNNLILGYQATSKAAAFNLPKGRWVVGYNIDVWKNTNFGVEWDHDIAYSASRGGTGDNSNLVTIRAAIMFG